MQSGRVACFKLQPSCVGTAVRKLCFQPTLEAQTTHRPTRTVLRQPILLARAPACDACTSSEWHKCRAMGAGAGTLWRFMFLALELLQAFYERH